MMKMVLILTMMLAVLMMTIMAMIIQFFQIHTALFGCSQNTTVPNITTPFPSMKVGVNVQFLLA